MVIMFRKNEGSALILCIVLMIAMVTVFAGLHIRLQLFTQTVYEREQYLKVRAATQGLMACALDKACKEWFSLMARKQKQEQFVWPIDNKLKAQASVHYQEQEMADGKDLKVAVTLTHKQRVCNAYARVRPVYDQLNGKIKHYAVRDWTIS